MYYALTYILFLVERHLYLYYRKAFGEYCDIQIAIDNEMKLKIYYISILNEFWV